MNSLFSYPQSEEKFSFERTKPYVFGQAQYSVTKSEYYGMQTNMLGSKIGIAVPCVEITTDQNFRDGNDIRTYIATTHLSSKICEIVLKGNIKSPNEIEIATTEVDSEIYKLLHGPIEAGQYRINNLLRSKDNSLRLQISSKGTSIMHHIGFKTYMERLRSGLADVPALIEVLDRAMSLAVSIDRGALLREFHPLYATEDFELNDLQFLKKFTAMNKRLQQAAQQDSNAQGNAVFDVVLRLSQNHENGCGHVHRWLDMKLHKIITSTISDDVLRQLSSTQHESGTHMIIELFRRFGKFEPRELKDVEDQLRGFTFTNGKDETDPYEGPNGINKFMELYSLLLGQKSGFTEQDGITFLLNSIETDPVYKVITDITNSNHKQINGNYESLNQLCDYIIYLHAQYHRIAKKRKQQETKPNKNGNKSSKYPLCTNPECKNPRHPGGIAKCWNPGGGAYSGNPKGKIKGQPNSTKPNDNANVKEECTNCGYNNHKTKDCTITKICDICGNMYRKGGHYDCTKKRRDRDRAAKAANKPQNNTGVQVHRLNRWGKGIKEYTNPISSDSDDDDEGRNPKFKKDSDSA